MRRFMGTVAPSYGPQPREMINTVGPSANDTSVGSYTSFETWFLLTEPFLLQELRADLKAGTYTLSIDLETIGVQTIVGGDTLNVQFAEERLLSPGWHYFKAISTASINWYVNLTTGFSGDLWTCSSVLWNPGSTTVRTMPVRLVGYIMDWTEI